MKDRAKDNFYRGEGSRLRNVFHRNDPETSMYLGEIMTISRIEFRRGLYSDLLPTDSPGNRITSAAGTRRNLELRNTESCGKYRADINQDLLETFFFSSRFYIHYRRPSILVSLLTNKPECTRIDSGHANKKKHQR